MPEGRSRETASISKDNLITCMVAIESLSLSLFPRSHDIDKQGDLDREVDELEERATEATKLTEPRENSYIEFRVIRLMIVSRH